MKASSLALLSAVVAESAAQKTATPWGQCGGENWTGALYCSAGQTCVYINYWYSQCQPGASTSTTTTTSVGSSTAKPSTTTSKPPSSTTSSTKVTTSTSTKPSSTTVVTTSSTTSSIKTTTTSSVTPIKDTTTIATAAPSSTGIKYLITFGDSYSQTGFDPKGTLASASNPLGNPYFPGWTTTGGANWIGYYITQFNSSPIYSYNFAYGGATTDASLVTPYAPTVLSFIDQVNQYLTSTKTVPGFVQWTASNSLFGIWMGVNDVGNSWYLSNYNTLLTKIIAQYISQTQMLYNNGARNFLFLSVPPIQLTPNVVAQGSAASGEAAAIAQYNTALSTAVANFAAANPGAKTWIVDTQKPFLTALNNPTAYGAPDATCFDASGTKCLWFNDYHPGQAIQKLVAQAVAAAVGNW